MSTTVTSTATFGMDAFASLAVVPSASDTRGTITFTSAAPNSRVPSFSAKLQAKEFGPFLAPMTVSIVVEDGSCTYQLTGHAGGYSYDSSGNVTGLVGPDGNAFPGPNGVTGYKRYPFALLSKIPGTSTYVGTETVGAYGDYGRGVVEYTYADGAFTKRKIVDAKVALPVSGGSVLTDGAVLGAWGLSSGAVLVAFRSSSGAYANKVFLLRTNVARDNFGSGATPTDKRAVMNVGELSGVHPEQIRILHARSICEATINSAKVLLFAEYSTATGRVSGSTNDWVRLHKSTDDGVTWSVVLEWNTDGTHRADHLHFVVQNPYTKMIYIGSGDDTTSFDERFVITWDGVSAPPAANTVPSDFPSTAGWGYIGGTELARLGDLLFYPDRAIAIPDCDTQGADTTSDAFVGVIFDPKMSWLSSACSIDRVDNNPPIIGAKDSAGNAVWVSFIQTSATDKSYYVWISRAIDKGEAWVLAARIKNYGTLGGMAFGFWYDTDLGGFVLSGVSASQFQPASTAKTIEEGQNITGATVIFRLIDAATPGGVYIEGDNLGQ